MVGEGRASGSTTSKKFYFEFSAFTISRMSVAKLATEASAVFSALS